MFHYRLERMLSSVVTQEELITILTHLTNVGSEHTVDGPDKRIHRIARAI